MSLTKFHARIFFHGSLYALGIGAASFCSVAEKDIAESPTAIAGTPKIINSSQLTIKMN